jgi:hypothetical protein
METLLWFVSDSRGGLHQTLLQREQEYQQHQHDVLAATMAHREDGSDIEEDHEIDDDGDDDDDDSSLTIRIEDPSHDEKTLMEGAAVFEMKDDSENDENLDDDSIRREIRLKETDKHAYFDTLNDILE